MCGMVVTHLLLALCLLILRTGSLDFNYHNYVSMEAFLNNISSQYPNITHLYSIGQSVEGRHLWVLAIGLDPREHVDLKPQVKYIGNMHGNEVVSREVLLHLIEYYVSSYGTNATITRFLNSTTVHIMPSMNPDGFEVSVEGTCLGLTGRTNARGFDLNRNFPDYFIATDDSHIQVEAKHVMDWLNNYTFVLSANLHGGSLVANYPFDTFGKGGSPNSISPDDDVFRHLSLIYSRTHHYMHSGSPDPFCAKKSFINGITNGAEWYPVVGGMQDYNYMFAGCMEITVEIACCKYPNRTELPQFWFLNREPLVNLLLQVEMGVKGLILDKDGNRVAGAVLSIGDRDIATFSSSRHGEFWRLLLPGSYTLQVTAQGYTPVRQLFTVGAGEVTRVDVTLPPAYTSGSTLTTASTFILLCSAITFFGIMSLL